MPGGKYIYNDPEYWGATAWDYLFKMALASPPFFTLRDKLNYKTWIIAAISVIPCPDCKKHAELFVKKNPPETNNQKQLVEYILKLRHNADYHARKKKRFELNLWKERNPL